jgi:hypothetical protein
MKKAKTLVMLVILIIFTMFYAPVHGADNMNKGSDKKICDECEKFPGVKNFKDFASDLNLKILSKLVNLNKHVFRSSPVSQDIAHLSHLKDSKNKKVVFWFPLFEF